MGELKLHGMKGACRLGSTSSVSEICDGAGTSSKTVKRSIAKGRENRHP
jgi:hypothetical protein